MGWHSRPWRWQTRQTGDEGFASSATSWPRCCPFLLSAPRADRLPAHSDYINPIDLCNRLNTYIIPEVAVHGFLTFLFLINGYWVPLILNLPLLGWNAKK